ncbi:MAG: MBL fold metallo-hydrolase [Bryobacteraceae bacterium]|jgi:glyoxylase-like metal-dependent hydrolase (beta-lactamase superfamily II)
MIRFTRRELFQIASSIAPTLWFARSAAAQTPPALELHPLGDKLTLLTGAGGNIAILQAEDGLLLIDSGFPQTAEAVDNRARSVGPPNIRVLINTHFHFDHVGGNERLGREGVRIIAHENVLKRLSTPQKNVFLNREFPAMAPEGRPAETFSSGGELRHGSERVLYRHVPPAHTDGDSTIHFQNNNIYHAGDLLFNGMYPFIDYSAGGSIEGMVAAADQIIDAVDGKTQIIPGHGPMAVRDDVRAFRAMLASVNEQVTGLLHAGKTLEQAQAAEPTKAWDEKWGKGFLKGADFVRMLYAGKNGGRA